MLPTVVVEELVTSFTYWNDGVQQGMLFGNELYAQVKSYGLDNRLDAYKDGCELSTAKVKACITVSVSGYTLWVSLRTLPSINKNSHSAEDCTSNRLDRKSNNCIASDSRSR